MSLGIAALSWVTPLGSDIEEIWSRLLAGETAPLECLADPETKKEYLVRRVSPLALKQLPPQTRLRRASAISRFAAAAGLTALRNFAGPLDRTALIFAVSNGGVIYTRRFYSEIVKAGSQGASHLLFPETVFNAPASHLAAILGLQGASYTVVGDGAAGILALKLAEDLLAGPGVDSVLVVAAEEIDPLVCEAYRRWRLLRNPTRPENQHGMILSEGAGAVLLTKEKRELQLSAIDAGTTFFRRTEAAEKLRKLRERLETSPSIIVGSANGTFIDRAERSALGAIPYSPKPALGDSVGASVLWQLIAATQILKTARVPNCPDISVGSSAVVLSCGLNQQIGGLRVQLG